MNYSTFNFQSKEENYKAAQDIFVRTLDIELDRDWSVGLCAMLGYGHTRTFFLEHFSGCGSDVCTVCMYVKLSARRQISSSTCTTRVVHISVY